MDRPAIRRLPVVIRLFGPLEIDHGTGTLGPRDLGGTRPKQVLEILLAARGHRVPTDRLADLLWTRKSPRNASGSPQTFVSVLRSHVAADREHARELVVTEPEAYRFATDLVDLDLDRFDQLVAHSGTEAARPSRRSLEQALKLVRGDVLEDEPYAPWAQDLRTTYQARVLGTRHDAADAALAELDYGVALVHAEAAAVLDVFSERAHRTMMLALYGAGRQHDALQTYQRLRGRLDQELGLGPSPETRELEGAILRQEDVRSLVATPVRLTGKPSGERPLRLLGRTGELSTLRRAAQHALTGSSTLLHVQGESGIGKTRLLEELVGSLDGVPIGQARCSELEQHLPYVPLAAALRQALIGRDVDLRHWPALGRIMPELKIGRRPRRSAEIEALEALADLVAVHAPLVLVIDDLQWADSATLAALSYLRRRCAGIAAVLVTASRCEPAFDHPVRSLRPDVVVRLEPLTPAELGPLGIPGLHASTGGNPRFVTAAIADRSPHGLGLAPSGALTESVRAQCRAEGTWPYRVLVAAATLDQPFGADSLAVVLHADATVVVDELERLCERRILHVDGFGFRFRHIFVREALLDNVSPARKRLVTQRLDQLGVRPPLTPAPQPG